jgi:hypothetical protein
MHELDGRLAIHECERPERQAGGRVRLAGRQRERGSDLPVIERGQLFSGAGIDEHELGAARTAPAVPEPVGCADPDRLTRDTDDESFQSVLQSDGPPVVGERTLRAGCRRDDQQSRPEGLCNTVIAGRHPVPLATA